LIDTKEIIALSAGFTKNPFLHRPKRLCRRRHLRCM